MSTPDLTTLTDADSPDEWVVASGGNERRVGFIHDGGPLPGEERRRSVDVWGRDYPAGTRWTVVGLAGYGGAATLASGVTLDAALAAAREEMRAVTAGNPTEYDRDTTAATESTTDAPVVEDRPDDAQASLGDW